MLTLCDLRVSCVPCVVVSREHSKKWPKAREDTSFTGVDSLKSLDSPVVFPSLHLPVRVVSVRITCGPWPLFACFVRWRTLVFLVSQDDAHGGSRSVREEAMLGGGANHNSTARIQKNDAAVGVATQSAS